MRLAARSPLDLSQPLENTDYQLSNSIVMPGPSVRLLPPSAESPPAPANDPRSTLDPEARALFHQRLRLCCLIAAVPFAFFFVCASTNFIEPLGHNTVGIVGQALSGLTLLGLLCVAVFLVRHREIGEPLLRALEVGVFGMMGLCFAYWQFMVLTADPFYGFEGLQHERTSVLAAALLVHFNWFVLLVFHGVLVPNSLARGAGVTIGMCVLAVSISVVATYFHVPTAKNAGVLFAISFTMLAAGAGLSVFGVAKTEALREQVRTAREAVRELGHYRLRKKLGSGGMGEVYLAEHRLLKRPCALKRIHPKYLNNPEQVKRFKREVQATARLRHPNTVEIYDYGEAEDGTFFYVMEYLPGMSLEEMVTRSGPLEAERVVHLLRQVCGALREAHRVGLVHRDIKPSNILVFPHGSPHDQVKLVDFGLVHTLGVDDDDREKITRDGLIVGTPEYMSPEQASGGKLDGRSDLFSLGSVAYFLLTGKEIFNRGNPMKTLMAVVGEELPPLANFAPATPPDVLAIVARCLAKDPNNRFQSAGELEDAFASCECADHWTEPQATAWWEQFPDVSPPLGTILDDELPVTLEQTR